MRISRIEHHLHEIHCAFKNKSHTESFLKKIHAGGTEHFDIAHVMSYKYQAQERKIIVKHIMSYICDYKIHAYLLIPKRIGL